MQFYWEGRKIHIVFTLYGLLALVTVGEIKGKLDDKDPSFLDHNIDKHVIFALPLSQGAYDFDVDGFIPKLPLQRMGSIHKEMIDTIKKVADRKKQIQHILTVSNTINKDLDQLKYKIEQVGVAAKDIDKKSLKADGFIFLAGHSTLMCNFVIYFPDIMKQLLIRNPTFDANVKWAIQFVVQAKLIKEEKLAKPFNLAQQELEMIPKDPNYHNPYKYENRMQSEPTPSTTTTKKPRRKLQRGPRLSGGEL
ncbi:uncharacterized protein LOC110850658 isoform X1 [Folsomia candida]|uniref:uncharacterized protein LOC110850658 isoform X1 n=1 Tax=Folsomia candida TaxID=158441 RepID=UPI000B8FD862|nr:uncharacterized protein LOC110850658 isoform X1 [Folsomia candida]